MSVLSAMMRLHDDAKASGNLLLTEMYYAVILRIAMERMRRGGLHLSEHE